MTDQAPNTGESVPVYPTDGMPDFVQVSSSSGVTPISTGPINTTPPMLNSTVSSPGSSGGIPVPASSAPPQQIMYLLSYAPPPPASGSSIPGLAVTAPPPQTYLAPSSYTMPGLTVPQMGTSQPLPPWSLPANPWSSQCPLPAVTVADHLPPVPAKLVSRIRGGAFVDFAELLPAALIKDTASSDPSLSRPPPQASRPRLRSFEDWLLGWTIFSSVLLSASPHRARDLLAYLATILQAFQDFGGDRWLAYDRSFRRNAAARQLTDWSTRDLNLWSYAFTRPACRFCEFCEAEHAPSAACIAHSASSSAPSTAPRPRPSEPQGTHSASEICRSWNRGRCTSPRDTCIYRHACGECQGSHRASACQNRSSFRDSASASKRPRPGDDRGGYSFPY